MFQPNLYDTTTTILPSLFDTYELRRICVICIVRGDMNRPDMNTSPVNTLFAFWNGVRRGTAAMLRPRSSKGTRTEKTRNFIKVFAIPTINDTFAVRIAFNNVFADESIHINGDTKTS